jgi:dihydrofolate reductase
MTTGKVIAAVAVSVDGFIAGAGDGPGQPLGRGGERLFTWFEDGETPGRFYPWMKMSAARAAAFDGFIARIGAVITGRRTYDIAGAWDGQGEVPGAPLFVVTHRVPDAVPRLFRRTRSSLTGSPAPSGRHGPLRRARTCASWEHRSSSSA